MQSDTRHNAPDVLAAMREKIAADQQHNQNEPRVFHVYPFEGGGFVVTDTPVEAEEDTQQPTIIESVTPTQPFTQPAHSGSALFSVLRCAALVLFLLFLDSASPLLTDIFTPTAVITLIPTQHHITLRSTAELGKLLDPITLTESQTAKATGKGHQDAERAAGTLTFYNASFSPQTIAAGSVFTGSDGIPVITEDAVTIPADNPPVNGQATTTAHAANPGVAGNISALDINGTVSNSLYVRNLTAFTGGQDERDFSVVRQADIDEAAANLATRVTSSMRAALNGQVVPGEQMQPQPCHPQTTADHQARAEATSVTVTVSLTCSAIVFNTMQLQTNATHVLTTQAHKQFGAGYMLSGNAQVSVTKASIHNKTVILTFTTQGTYIYQLTAKMQDSIKALLFGKPRLTALHQLALLPGIRQVSIGGISDNQELPTDPHHIHLLIISLVS